LLAKAWHRPDLNALRIKSNKGKRKQELNTLSVRNLIFSEGGALSADQAYYANCIFSGVEKRNWAHNA
jgi:hypothetical protein